MLNGILPHPVWDTHIAASTCASVATSSLFVRMLAASSNPNREWSVNMVWIPRRWACRIASCPSEDNEACAWIRLILSRIMMVLKYGRKVKKLGSVADEAMAMKGI